MLGSATILEEATVSERVYRDMHAGIAGRRKAAMTACSPSSGRLSLSGVRSRAEQVRVSHLGHATEAFRGRRRWANELLQSTETSASSESKRGMSTAGQLASYLLRTWRTLMCFR